MWEKNENKQKRGRVWPIFLKTPGVSDMSLGIVLVIVSSLRRLWPFEYSPIGGQKMLNPTF